MTRPKELNVGSQPCLTCGQDAEGYIQEEGRLVPICRLCKDIQELSHRAEALTNELKVARSNYEAVTRSIQLAIDYDVITEPLIFLQSRIRKDIEAIEADQLVFEKIRELD